MSSGSKTQERKRVSLADQLIEIRKSVQAAQGQATQILNPTGEAPEPSGETQKLATTLLGLAVTLEDLVNVVECILLAQQAHQP